MTLPRVLIVSATPLVGPWATSDLMSALFSGWDRSALAQVTLTRERSIPDEQEIDSTYLSSERVQQLLYPARIRSVIKRVRPDVIFLHSAGWPLALDATAALVAGNVPVVVHVMDDWPSHSNSPIRARADSLIMRALLNRASHRFAISEAMATSFNARFGKSFDVAHSSTTIAPASDVSPPSQSGQVLYSGTASQRQTRASLFAAAEAVHQLRKKGSSAALSLCASPLSDTDKRRLETLDVELLERAPRDEYLGRLRDASVLLLPFNFDPSSRRFLAYSQPNKLPELMGSGRPILLFGPPDLAITQTAQNEGWAHVVTENNPSTLASALDELLSDVGLRTRIVQRARAVLSERFDKATMRQRFEAGVVAAAISGGSSTSV